MGRKLFLNLPIKNLERTMGFFKSLGFTFNPKFTDAKAACMVISEEAFAMLLTEPFFETFTKKKIADATKQVEGIFAMSCDSRGEVDTLVDKAIAAGGSEAGPTQDHGFMYQRSFFDLDNHHWEVFWMDSRAIEQGPGQPH